MSLKIFISQKISVEFMLFRLGNFSMEPFSCIASSFSRIRVAVAFKWQFSNFNIAGWVHLGRVTYKAVPKRGMRDCDVNTFPATLRILMHLRPLIWMPAQRQIFAANEVLNGATIFALGELCCLIIRWIYYHLYCIFRIWRLLTE